MIEIDDQLCKPLNLANSAVLRAVEEEEQQMKCGYKRVAWPPAGEERVVREFTPQPQTQYQSVPSYNQQQQPQQQQQQPQQQQHPYQPSAVPSTQQHQYQPPQQQPKQYSPQPQYQAQAPSQNQYQQPQQQYQQPPWAQQQHLPQPYKPPTQQTQYQAPPQQYQAASYQQQPQQQPNYQAPLNNQYQAPSPYQAPSQNQFVSQPNQQQQFNSYSQPQHNQGVPHGNDLTDNLQQGHDQRGASPGIITLRKEAPISQAPAPVYTSQPAAVSYQGDDDISGGNKLRGDLKWPPPEYKEAAARENEERRQLALGPVCRPRKINRDYTSFFAKNALSHHYPSYKVPPGTQHMTY